MENTEGLSREMGKHELRSIRSSVMVLSPLRGGQAKLTSLFIFFLFKLEFYSAFKHLVPLVFRVHPIHIKYFGNEPQQFWRFSNNPLCNTL